MVNGALDAEARVRVERAPVSPDITGILRARLGGDAWDCRIGFDELEDGRAVTVAAGGESIAHWCSDCRGLF